MCAFCVFCLHCVCVLLCIFVFFNFRSFRVNSSSKLNVKASSAAVETPAVTPHLSSVGVVVDELGRKVIIGEIIDV